jgi:RND family efflux transporter MFP subunit
LLACTTAQAQVTTTFTEPYERIEVSAAELGIVQSVDVTVGDAVTRDQLLGQLDSGVLHESRRLAQHRAESTARIDAARADLKLKQGMYENLQPLLRSGHANPTEVDRSKTEYEHAQAALQIAGDEMAEAKIELARIDAQIRQRQIRSPIDGIVVDIHRRPGEYLQSNRPQFATVVDISKLRIRFFVSTRYAQQLRKGETIDVLIGADRFKTAANIEFVSPITESQSGTVRLDLLVDNARHQLRSGVICQLADDDQARDPGLANSLRSSHLQWER